MKRGHQHGRGIQPGTTPSRPAKPAKSPGLRLLALEPRLMFDGAVAASIAEHVEAVLPAQRSPVTAEPPAGDWLTTRSTEPRASEAPVAAQSSRQVVFIDATVANYQSLVAQVPSGMEVVVLQSARDGLAQIADWAQGHQGYAAIHIVSHGQSGDLILGGTDLTTASLVSHQDELQAIARSLNQNGDILVYGCNVGAGSSGDAFVSALARYTQADVAASTNATGAARLGGDWTLEREHGRVEATALHFDYDALLSRPSTGLTNFDTLDGRAYSANGGNLQVDDLLGWNFNVGFGGTSGAYQNLIVEKPNSINTEMVDAYSDGALPITYLEVKPNDGSRFTLNSAAVLISLYDRAYAGGAMLLQGYLDGEPVSGAVLALNLREMNNGSGQPELFDLSGNSAFKGIDSFRLMAADGHAVFGMIGVGNINAVDFGFAPEVRTSAGASAYSSGSGGAVTVDGALQLTDSDSTTLSRAEVSVSGNFQSGEDVLAFANTNATTFGNIASAYDSSTGTLTLTSAGSTATVAQWQAALRAVTYQNTSLTPSTASRAISFTASDNFYPSLAATRTLTVAANIAPVIVNLDGDTTAFTEKGGAVKLDTGAAVTVTDSDTASFNGGSLSAHLATNGQAAQDVLGISTGGAASLSNGMATGSTVSIGGVDIGTIAVNGDGASGHDVIISLNANATAARVSSLIAALNYNNTSNDPTTASRTIRVSLNDGRGGIAISDVTVGITAVNDAPIVSLSAGNPTFTPGGSAVAVFSGASVDTVEASQGIVQLTFNFTGLADGSNEILRIDGSSVALSHANSVMTAGNGLDISVSLSGSTATVTVISSAGLSNSRAIAVLNGITYRDSSPTPTGGDRTFTLISVRDNGGHDSGTDTSYVGVTSTITVSNAPVLTASAGSAAFLAGDNHASTPVVVDAGITLSSGSGAPIATATVAIDGGFHAGEDILGFDNTGSASFGNIAASYDTATGRLTLSSSGATASLAQWQAALRAVTYTDTRVTPNADTRVVSFQVSDGSNTSATVSRTVTVTPTDQTPIVGASGGTAAFASGDNSAATPVAIDPGLTLSDLDNTTLSSATVRIGSGFHAGQDVLGFSNTGMVGNIAGSYDAATGVLTLTSAGATATLSQWQLALRSVTYNNSAVIPDTATRTISFQISDGTKTSTAASRDVTVAATGQSPVATTSAGHASYSAGDNVAGTPVTVDPGLTLTDADSATLASASVSISGSFHAGQDVLGFQNTGAPLYGNITASYDAATGVLSLSSSGASATLAQWQAALRAVSYSNSAVVPDTAMRNLSFQVSDGGKTSAIATRDLSVAATAQTPLLSTSTGSGQYLLGTSGTTVDAGLVLSDRDSATLASATVRITGNFQAGEDSLSFSNTDTTTYGNITASYSAGTAELTLSSGGATATLAQWQAALRAVRYVDSAASPNVSSRTFSFQVDDGGRISAPASRTLSFTLAAPQISGLSSGGSATSSAHPTLVGSATAASLLTIYLDGIAVDTALADSQGRWTYTFAAALGDGDHVVSAKASHGGIDSSLSAVFNLLVDSTAPNAPAALRMEPTSDSGVSSGDGLTARVQPTFSGTAEAGSLVTVYIDDVVQGNATAGADGRWSFTPAGALTEGGHSLRASAADAVGNTSSLSDAYTFHIDTTAPAAPGSLGVAGATSSGLIRDTRPVLSGTAEAGSLVTIYVDDVAQGETIAGADGRWSFTPANALSEGSHGLRASATDAAGNTSPLSGTYTLRVDTTAPTAPGSLSVEGAISGGLTHESRPVFGGTADAGSAVTVYVDDVALGTTTAGANGRWNFTPAAALADGDHSLRASATDAAGNTSVLSSAYALRIDTTAPAAPGALAVAGASSAGLTRDTRPAFGGTAEAGSTVTVYVDDVALGRATVGADGRWSFTPSGALPEGSHLLRASAKDVAGNAGSLSGVLTFTIDSTAPRAPSFIQLDPPQTSAGSVRYELSFDEPVLGVDAGAFELVSGGNVQAHIAGVEALGGNRYRVTISDLRGEGQVGLALKANVITDLAGNALPERLAAPTYQVLTPFVPPAPAPQPPLDLPAPVPLAGLVSAPPVVAMPPLDAAGLPGTMMGSGTGSANAGSLGSSGLLSGPSGLSGIPGLAPGQLIAPEVLNALGAPSAVFSIGQDHFSPEALQPFDQAGSVSPPFQPLPPSPVQLVSSLVTRETAEAGAPMQLSRDLGSPLAVPGRPFTFALPPGAIKVRAENQVVDIQVHRADGRPLPAWLNFDAATGRFSGMVPPNFDETLELELSVRDQLGNRATSTLEIHPERPSPTKRTAPQSQPSRPLAPGREALQQQLGQQGQSAFEAQVSQWLTPERIPEQPLA